MRMIVDMEFPLEPFNTMVKNGTVGQTIEKVLGEIKPEAVYFCARGGKRGGTMIVDFAGCIRYPESRRAPVPGVRSVGAIASVHDAGRPEEGRFGRHRQGLRVTVPSPTRASLGSRGGRRSVPR